MVLWNTMEQFKPTVQSEQSLEGLLKAWKERDCYLVLTLLLLGEGLSGSGVLAFYLLKGLLTGNFGLGNTDTEAFCEDYINPFFWFGELTGEGHSCAELQQSG